FRHAVPDWSVRVRERGPKVAVRSPATLRPAASVLQAGYREAPPSCFPVYKTILRSAAPVSRVIEKLLASPLTARQRTSCDRAWEHRGWKERDGPEHLAAVDYRPDATAVN